MTCVVEDGLLGALRQAITSALKDLWPWGTDICCLKIIRELLQKAAGFENTMHQISFTFFRLWAKGTHKSPIEVNAREKVLFLQTNMQLIRHGLCTAPCLHFARSSSPGWLRALFVCLLLFGSQASSRLLEILLPETAVAWGFEVAVLWFISPVNNCKLKKVSYLHLFSHT